MTQHTLYMRGSHQPLLMRWLKPYSKDMVREFVLDGQGQLEETDTPMGLYCTVRDGIGATVTSFEFRSLPWLDTPASHAFRAWAVENGSLVIEDVDIIYV